MAPSWTVRVSSLSHAARFHRSPGRRAARPGRRIRAGVAADARCPFMDVPGAARAPPLAPSAETPRLRPSRVAPFTIVEGSASASCPQKMPVVRRHGSRARPLVRVRQAATIFWTRAGRAASRNLRWTPIPGAPEPFWTVDRGTDRSQEVCWPRRWTLAEGSFTVALNGFGVDTSRCAGRGDSSGLPQPVKSIVARHSSSPDDSDCGVGKATETSATRFSSSRPGRGG